MKFPIGTRVRLVNYPGVGTDGLSDGLIGTVVGFSSDTAYTGVVWDGVEDYTENLPALHIDRELVEAP